jgi:hypothetical protein
MSRAVSVHPSRRGLIGCGLALCALAWQSARAATAPTPPADGIPNLSKSAVGYRDIPERGKHCGNCRWFLAAADSAAPGHCQLVAGQISPTGWCDVWTPHA